VIEQFFSYMYMYIITIMMKWWWLVCTRSTRWDWCL